jgi:cytidylate kinase
MTQFGVITIDGPAASGKSSVGRRLAQVLGIPYVSSGLLYRAATLLVLAAEADSASTGAVMEVLGNHAVQLQPGLPDNRLLVDGRELSSELHTDEIDRHVSQVAAHGAVREWVDDKLRSLAGDFVAEGRDMGTAVFPHSRYKFYLTAPVEVRAQRRLSERNAGLAELTDQLARRDELDALQLRPAPDARIIDTGEIDIASVVARLVNTVSGEDPGDGGMRQASRNPQGDTP